MAQFWQYLSKVGKIWPRSQGKKDILELGNLDSYRIFCHADDVAKAIKIIVLQEKGNNYNICGSNLKNIKLLITDLYKNFGINLRDENNFLLNENNEIVIQYNNCSNIQKRPDVDILTLITGINSNLVELGWCIDDNSFLDKLVNL